MTDDRDGGFAPAAPDPTDAAAPVTDGPGSRPVGLGARGWARWAWRNLTSMRTALLLLLLVAVAAVPGSIFPQRGIDPVAVSNYLRDNPTLGPWLARLGFFSVYSSVWFSAIYLLLVVSVIGCVVPRTRLHLRALRSAPPAAPSRLRRLPAYTRVETDADPDDVLAAARAALRRSRYRVRADPAGTPADPAGTPADTGAAAANTASPRDRSVAGETGYLRETGNLLFHAGILVVIVALAWGYLVGWKADRIVPVGQSFTNTVSGYDTFAPGPWVDADDLVPFTVHLDRLDVRFEESDQGAQFGAARDFRADTTVTPYPGAAPEQRDLRVNGPLTFGDASVYLLGNGYAPRLTVRDAAGAVLYEQATPFLPQDGVYTSAGAVKVPGARPEQLGFTGVLLPTAAQGPNGPESVFPDLRDPVLILNPYVGELFAGGAESVYTLDTSGLTALTGADGKAARLELRPGQTVALPGGRGTVTLEGIDRWAGVSTRYDPAKPLALTSALVALLGLVASLLIRRRRLFVRVGEPGPDGRRVVEVAGLARGEDATLQGAVDALAARLPGVGAADGPERAGDGSPDRSPEGSGPPRA
ncbi:cytochrome c biogenesis protein ResB [Agilicoccus flavus]|uniref:cytochrome c biogenesis protein ResB n=1 Tax=Agilicoccus flavus TaxID=2775968 RepID=UPI001CF6744D|nr:cytochrome c biogenesis protein ResB [Agilicoccus flavus]